MDTLWRQNLVEMIKHTDDEGRVWRSIKPHDLLRDYLIYRAAKPASAQMKKASAEMKKTKGDSAGSTARCTRANCQQKYSLFIHRYLCKGCGQHMCSKCLGNHPSKECPACQTMTRSQCWKLKLLDSEPAKVKDRDAIYPPEALKKLLVECKGKFVLNSLTEEKDLFAKFKGSR